MIPSQDHDAWMLETSAALSRLQPLDGAIRLLRLAGSDGADRGEAADWPLASRDLALLQLAQDLFGDELACVATCPGCGELQEFELSASVVAKAIVPNDAETIRIDDWEIGVVPLTSRLIAEAVTAGGLDDVEVKLAKAAVEQVRRLGDESIVTPIPDQLIRRLIARIEAREAQGEALVAFACANCGNEWSDSFDAGSHLRERIDETAARLLREIATLARAFGWSERETLALPPVRRRAYVEMVAA